jgi:TonB-linked SusC/RagA family outer membrane protein
MKKNGPGVWTSAPQMFIKCLLMVKFTILLIFAFSLQSFSRGYGQDNISLKLEKASLKKIFKVIEQQGMFRFVYKDEILPREQRISIAVENATLDDVLKKILQNTALTYKRLSGSLVVITADNAIPEISVNGKITDEKGDPLAGVSVVEKGTSSGTVTNDDGLFVLNVESATATLVISSVGYIPQELALANKTWVNIQLKAANQNMQEVVVVGYGQQRKSLVTGAISSIKAEQLNTVSSTRIEQALQGRAAGVNILPSSGQPGAALKVRIRGTGSNRGNEPLYIIDGVRAGGIEYIDPAEIGSIEILKDAASAAIYGAEGANGVIIITTKTGRKNSSDISYSAQYGQQSVKDDYIKMMNAQQYQQYLAAANTAGAPTPADVQGLGEGTNWLKEVTQTAPQHHHTLTFSGGSDKSTYLVSGSYFTQEGIVGGKKSKFDRYTVRFNGDSKIKPWLNIGNRISVSQNRRRAISDNDEFGSILASALVMDPITPVTYTDGVLPAHVQAALAGTTPTGTPIASLLRRDELGNLYGLSNFLKGEYGNPISRIGHAKGQNVQTKIVGNVYAEVEPIKNLKITTRFGVDAASQYGHGWIPTYWYSSESLNAIASGSDYSDNWFTWQWENFANYSKKIDQHNFTLLAGTSIIKTTEHHMGGSYSGLFKEDDLFSYADNVPDDVDRIGSIGRKRTLASVFGRLSYDFDGKYLFYATIRRDGSSKFAPGYQWGTFPSLSAGWVISNEKFFAGAISDVMNYAKIRASWGQNGSLSSVGDGEWKNAVSSGFSYPDANGNLINGAAPGNLANPTLTWETSEQIDIGADLAFLKNRLSITADYYKKTTKDLLTGGSAPFFAGAPLLTVNAGEVVNKGFELEVAYKSDTKGDFSYEIAGNFTTVKNRVTKLDPNTPFISGGDVGTGWTTTVMRVGQPIWYFSGYQTDGIFQTQDEINKYLQATGITGYAPKPGEPVVLDVNGDKQISNADQTFIGTPHAKIVYGGRVNLAYKGIDFLFFIQGQAGNDIVMGFNRTDRATANKPEFFYSDRWTGAGSTNTWFAPNTSNPYIYNSDLMVFKGSFARIRQMQLGYTLPAAFMNKAKIKNARLYVSLDDFFTFTNYPGVDPEGGSNEGNSIGIDRGGYPIPRKAMVGLSLTF